MIKTIIVEDDPVHQRNLQSALAAAFIRTDVAAVCTNVPDAVAAIDSHQPELLLLDIDLGGGETGFDLLKRYRTPGFAVIFTTQHNSSHNAIRAIRASALDFLPKPFLPEELDEALERFINNRATNVEQTQSLSEQIATPGETLTTIWIPGAGGRLRLEIDNIRYCESDNSYTTFHLVRPIGKLQAVTSSRKIKDYESMLAGTGIFRLHNEYLVNLRFVEKFKPNGNGGLVFLDDGTSLNVSRTKKDELVKRLRLRGSTRQG